MMHFVIQSKVKSKPEEKAREIFVLCGVYRYETALNSDWFTGLFGSLVIGQNDYLKLDFGFSTPN